MTDTDRFQRAIALFDAANAEDPNQDQGHCIVGAKIANQDPNRFSCLFKACH